MLELNTSTEPSGQVEMPNSVPGIRERTRHNLVHVVHAKPGDAFVCTIRDDDGKLYRFRESIGREITINTVVTFDVATPILGRAEGVGALFGCAQSML